MSKVRDLKIAKVLVPYPFDKTFDYIVSNDMELVIGNIVKVPFGRRMVMGVIFGFGESNFDIAKLKEVKEKLNFPPLKQELLDFIGWVSKYNLIPLGNVLKMVIGVIGSFGKVQSRAVYGVFQELISQRFIKSENINLVSNSPFEGESRKTSPEGTKSDSVGGYKHLYSKEILERAKELRQNTTDAEGLLWWYLKDKQLGFKFRRQQPIDKYIVDFICLEKKLIVELDGRHHNNEKNIKYNNERSNFLKSQGFNIIRIWNNELFTNTDGVLESIYNFLHKGIIPLTESDFAIKGSSFSTLPQGESESIKTSNFRDATQGEGNWADVTQKQIKLTQKQQILINFLTENSDKFFTTKEIEEQINIKTSTIKTLVKKGLIEQKTEVEDFEIQVIDNDKFNLYDLSDEQIEAFEFIDKKVKEKKHSVVVLEGATGSGKTEVYFHLIADILNESRQTLILLPEIALTTQLISRFEKQFGFTPAVWHSQITSANKRKMWNGIVSGDIKVIIGARSALFLPFKNLALIVVDEEHDQSFKQSENGSYNGRDMAIVRAKLNEIPIVLSSATPSLETLINAETGKYHRLHLPSRFGNAVMPDIDIIDLKKQKLKYGQCISTRLITKIREHLENKKQVLLFLNRRGYSPIILCTGCGHKMTCPNCSVTLTKHKSANCLMCHCCGYYTSEPKICPECSVPDTMMNFGMGVERIEEEVQKNFPNARTAVITSDTVNTPTKSAQMINKVINKEIDIIIGTQLVAKGHHFPSLTLVGILDADASLFGGDMRASERTYQLLTQVSGRAGRELDRGLVMLQTYTPENLVLQAIKGGNKEILIDFEKQNREIMGFPPYGKLALVVVTGRDELKVREKIREFVRALPAHKDIEILGPVPSPVARVKREFRYRIFIKTSRRVNIQGLLRDMLGRVKVDGGMRVRVDVDPI